MKETQKIEFTNNRNCEQIKYFLFAFLFLGLMIFCILGIYTVAAPRWTQIAYSRLDWETFGGIYEYPKTQPYTLDYFIPLIAGIYILIGLIFTLFLKKKVKKQNIHGLLKVFTLLGIIITSVVGTGGIVLGAPEMEFYAYNAGPYLTWGTEGNITQDPTSGITICWHSKFNTPSQVKYGNAPDNLDKLAVSSGIGRFHQVPMNELESNTTYYYKISGFKIKQFRTAPFGRFDYSCYLWADPRTNNGYDSAIEETNMPKIISEHAKEDGIDMAFSICAGDITARGVDYKTWKLWLNDISTNDFTSNYSHAVAIGNHERHDDTGAVNFPNYYPYQDKKDVHFSYSFDYGRVHFSILDRWNTSDPWYGGTGYAQAEWLEQDLIEHADTDFKILVMHNNPIITNEHHGDCSLIMNVAESQGIDVIFCGHTHAYQTYDFSGGYLDPGSYDQMVMMIGIGGNRDNLCYNGYCRIDINETAISLKPRLACDESHFEEFIIT
ncbi:MAG: hypothetical protein GF364_03215 [Candidatus Lokiarchaeota archaeon]|nr:hypothetical protein [Candidatus Lokiarchaeota archaeon]